LIDTLKRFIPMLPKKADWELFDRYAGTTNWPAGEPAGISLRAEDMELGGKKIQTMAMHQLAQPLQYFCLAKFM
jgi:hypothetical protein